MMGLLNKKQNRREFLKGFGRYLMLGGLVCTTGILMLKRKSAPADGKSVDINICRNCIILNKCDKPAALLAKEEMGK